MASTSKDQQKGKKGKTLPIVNPGGDRLDEEAAVPFSVSQALQNDLILDNIFSYLSVPDLKACRQVCHQWKQGSRRGLVEKCNPVGFFGRSVESRSGFKKIHRIEEMAKLTSVISSSVSFEFPVTKFMVGANIITDEEHGNGNMDAPGLEKILREFLEAIGPLATQLEIGFMDGAKLFQLDAPLNVEFPRLKTLKASPSVVKFLPRIDVIRSNLIFFQNILENAPQVSTLDIVGACSGTMDLLINLMERVVSKRKLSISTLHFRSDTSLLGHHFHRLANLGLKLTVLRLNLVSNWSSNEVREEWMKFLESQSETLEKLFVECHTRTWSPESPLGFPRLPKLKRLAVESVSIRYAGICYTKQFPSLEQLSLTDHNTVLGAFLNSDLPPVETVEILELPRFLRDPVWVWHAARIFPNVKKLTIPGHIEVVPSVFQAWQNVEELTISGIGWSGASANELLAVNFQGVLPSNYRLKTSGMPAEFLQGLKTLRLEGVFLKTPTTRICHFVLLKMGSLKCLDLSKCRSWGSMNPLNRRINPESKISERMLSKMRKKFLVLF